MSLLRRITASLARRHKLAALVAVVSLALVMSAAYAQRRFGGRQPVFDRNGVPTWEVDVEMPEDVFTFVRLRYQSSGRGYAWATDYPDADLNLSYRLQQLTSMRSHPDGKIVDITDPALFDHPFVYMIEPGDIVLSDEEAAILRRYLLSGGFLMVDDFWGDYEWDTFELAFKQIFPDRQLKELPTEHPVFHCVYDLKEKPQVPSIGMAQAGRSRGITYERSDAREPHYKGCFDDKGRMMMIVCHNTDLGDGWEREGEDEWYFREFSEKKSYPLGINILFYQFTH
ncbi:MAG: transmembrane prediction [Pirellula sp.]|nr:transmembrane prediction [Pirellula sp.]